MFPLIELLITERSRNSTLKGLVSYSQWLNMGDSKTSILNHYCQKFFATFRSGLGVDGMGNSIKEMSMGIVASQLSPPAPLAHGVTFPASRLIRQKEAIPR